MEERIKYHCKNCKYRFTRKRGQEVLRCPYCSKQGSVEVDSGNFASKMLDEVKGMEDR